MLAQSYKTAEELGLTEKGRDTLIRVLASVGPLAVLGGGLGTMALQVGHPEIFTYRATQKGGAPRASTR